MPLLAVVFLTLATTGARAQQSAWAKESGYYVVRGMVTDSITGEALPYASVKPAGATGGAVADSRGIFEFRVPANTRAIHVAMMGYAPREVPLRQTSHNMYVVRLLPEGRELKELVVKRKKYSKKNNPAVDFVRRIRTMSSETDPLRHPHYSYRQYERVTLGLNNFTAADSAKGRFAFVKEYVDTSEISGQPVLPLSVHETLKRCLFRRDPSAEKTIVEGHHADGIDEIADASSMQTFIEDVLPDIDLYHNDIPLLQNRFVSPLSSIGPDFYRYYLTDTIDLQGERCIVLSFYPRNKAAFGFTGHVYVPMADTTMFIRRVDMRVPRDINLNFVDNMLLTQTFEKAADGTRLKTSDDMAMELSIVPGTPSIYVRRRTNYTDHSFLPPADSAVFRRMGAVVEADSAAMRDSLWWASARLAPTAHGEARVGELMKRMRRVPLYYWGEKAVRVMSVGYVPTGNPSRFEIGPLNTFASYNSIEGLRLRFGGVTTAQLSPRWFGRAHAAYGFKDHRWKYGVEAEYSFHDKKKHSREFPVHALRFTSEYDLEFPGQHYFFTNADNVFLSLKRMSDNMALYKLTNKLQYILELPNNFSVDASIAHDQREATTHLPFTDGYGHSFRHFGQTEMRVQLRYAPGEKFYQTTSERIPISLDAPVVALTHTLSIPGFLGSRYAINKTELNLRKRFWLSAFGYVDGLIGAGHVWSTTPFISLLIPNANLSYTIQPESFALLNPMEFVNDSQLNWELTYWANGALFNLVPGFKKLKLREVVSFRGVWGHLSAKNDPASNPELLRFAPGSCTRPMNDGPYMEISAGIDNILRCLRVDYVWRLNYLDVPYSIDRRGLRIAFHATF